MEIAVSSFCSGTTGDIGDAGAPEHRRDGNEASAVERSVDELKRSASDLLGSKVSHAAGENGVVIGIEARVIDPFDQTLLKSLIEVHGLHAGERVGPAIASEIASAASLVIWQPSGP